MELPCKYSENGCKASGTKAVMQEHADSCLFAKIQCPLNRASCKEIMLKREVIIHLKNVHKAVMWNADAYGKINGASWSVIPQIKKTKAGVNGAATSFDGNTFFFNCIQQNWTLSFWVSILGSKKVAKKYEVKIYTSDNGESKAWIGNVGQVYSIDTSQEDVLADKKGVLELSKTHVEKKLAKLVEEIYKISLGYEIILK